MRAALRELAPPAVLRLRRRVREARLARTPLDRAAPFSPAYQRHKALALARTLADLDGGTPLEELEPFRDARSSRLDERLVELPWCLDALRRLGGPRRRLLDVGCTLNQELVAPRLAALFEERWLLNLAAEPVRGGGRASMVVADVRDAPLAESSFDAVTCLSTLEHVGMDNVPYTGVPQPPSADAAAEADLALAAMRRLLRAGGVLLVTVPFGAEESRGWFRVFGADDMARAVRLLGENRCTVRCFRVAEGGWTVAEPEECAGDRYGDGVPAARAVACIEYTHSG
jgi:SAM-dependent methyltransferase